MSVAVHPTAIVSHGAVLGEGVEVGPYAVIERDVKLGRGTRVGAHAHLSGPAEFGEGNRIFPHAVLGQEPQDLKYHGEPTRLVVGARNVFREFMTAHRGTTTGNGQTVIGDDGYFMSYSHIAHDCT
ncbi:MAG TPA: acyl-[acyl-carrier-protein]--UDP-N-acetylglucosamine O-acyltransferase, partial [Thermoanaerobaculia bacterium]|nr:acyl-[acyl-carrier-protein]--UDP-N-acetylglucosamine O-acyltransferase [Thermoanaerobaculia bacterium]